jgi:hypothetical protein
VRDWIFSKSPLADSGFATPRVLTKKRPTEAHRKSGSCKSEVISRGKNRQDSEIEVARVNADRAEKLHKRVGGGDSFENRKKTASRARTQHSTEAAQL